jgi:hypothetical protein
LKSQWFIAADLLPVRSARTRGIWASSIEEVNVTTAPKSPRARSPALLPDREQPYELQDVYERVMEGCRAELVLQWDGGYLLFRADSDSDSLEAAFHEGGLAPSREYRSLRSVPPWSDCIGKSCGWTWLAIDQQGCWDSALLSFDGIIPSVLLNVTASSIHVFSILRGEGQTAAAVKRP